MAVVMEMHWPGTRKEQYEALRPIVRWEEHAPEGAIFHVAWFDGAGAHVIDVWETEQDFHSFLERRLMPGVQQVGMEGEPDVTIHQAHAYFNAERVLAGSAA